MHSSSVACDVWWRMSAEIGSIFDGRKPSHHVFGIGMRQASRVSPPASAHASQKRRSVSRKTRTRFDGCVAARASASVVSMRGTAGRSAGTAGGSGGGATSGSVSDHAFTIAAAISPIARVAWAVAPFSSGMRSARATRTNRPFFVVRMPESFRTPP